MFSYKMPSGMILCNIEPPVLTFIMYTKVKLTLLKSQLDLSSVRLSCKRPLSAVTVEGGKPWRRPFLFSRILRTEIVQLTILVF